MTASVGGAERVLIDVAECSARRRSLCAIVPSGQLAVAFGEAGVPCAPFAVPASVDSIGDSVAIGSALARGGVLLGLLGALGAARSVAAAVRRELPAHPHVLHANGIKASVIGALARRRATRLVWHVHDYIGRRPLAGHILRLLARRCDLIVANSESVRDDVLRLFGSKIHTITAVNGIDLARFNPDGESASIDKLAGLDEAPAGTVRVGLVATYARWKGHDVFLRALARISDPTLRGYIVGGPIYATRGSQWTRTELVELSVGLGLEGRIGFVDVQKDVPAILRALDVAVHASVVPEPFGLSIVEAMACGRAVVLSASGGAAPLVEDGVDGLHHEPGDDDGLSHCIRRLARESGLRRSLGARARATAVARFDRERTATEIVRAWDSLLNGALNRR